MPRIALVTPILPVPHDPTRGRYIHETARALSKLADVRVFFAQADYPRLPGLKPRSFLEGVVGPDYSLPGIDLEALTYPAVPGLSRFSNGWVCGQVLKPRIRRFGADLVLGYWLYPEGGGALAAARSLGLPCVLGARGSDIHVRDGLNRWLTRRVVQGCDRLLTVSRAMRDAAIRDYGADPARSRAIINGFDTGVFHPRDQAALRAELGLDADAKLILYVGRFVEAKGMRELFAAFEVLHREDPRRQLVLVGDGVMRGELLALIEARGLQQAVHLPGAFEPEGVARWIGACDVLTLPSWSEGYPNVVVEAIACGRPVVATTVGGTAEIVDADSGLLVPPKEATALEAALREALSREWNHAAMAARLRRSWDDVAVDTLAVCRELLPA
jgi:glycosyltransferase involved in cell wall biosynthesis